MVGETSSEGYTFDEYKSQLENGNFMGLALDSDNELREAIIAAADVLKTSDKIVSAVERVVKSIEAGETRLQEVRELNRVKVSGIADVKKEAQALLSMSAKKPKKK